jgi:hypothetical protein
VLLSVLSIGESGCCAVQLSALPTAKTGRRCEPATRGSFLVIAAQPQATEGGTA